MLELRELTASGAGAVSVLELRGENALAAVAGLAGVPGSAGSVGLGGRERLAVGDVFATNLRLEDQAIDEALIVVPSEDRVELHLHGSPPLIAELTELLLRLLDAQPWSAPVQLEERAATLAGHAASEAGARILLDQAEGTLRRALEGVLGKDEATGRFELERLLEAGRQARYAIEPARVVLAGPVNAGKSTLFNLLVGEDRALISDLEGTTRDIVRARGQLGPWPVEWLDTAGERAAPGESVEEAGQALARRALAHCDLGFWLTPVDSGPPGDLPEPPEVRGLAAHRLVPLRTCADRLGQAAVGEGALSALAFPAEAVAQVTAAFERALGLGQPAWVAGRAVPFEAEQLELLADWSVRQPAERDRAIRSWLDAR